MAPVTETPAKASWLAVLLSYAGRCRGRWRSRCCARWPAWRPGCAVLRGVPHHRRGDRPAPDGGAVLAWVGAAAAGYVASKVLFGASTLLSHVSAYTILDRCATTWWRSS
ncbi:MAG: hypothetical protein ACLTMP_12740 [Eggerthella lenta]